MPDVKSHRGIPVVDVYVITEARHASSPIQGLFHLSCRVFPTALVGPAFHRVCPATPAVSAVIPNTEPTSAAPGLPPAPALGRFGPVALSVAAIAAISMGLIAWSHVGWNRLQQRAHAFDTRLLEARQEARHTRWLHTLASAATIPTASLVAPLRRALATRLSDRFA